MYENLIKKLRNRRVCIQSGGNLETDFPLLQEAADAIEKLATELATGSKNVASWIPASRPPEEPGQYLVFIRFPANDVENWEMFGLEAPVGMVAEAYFCKDQFLWKTESDAYNAMLDLVDAENDSAVTHWMPLPPEPEGET